MLKYFPFIFFLIISLIGYAVITKVHKNSNNIIYIFLFIYLICVWWLLFTPQSYAGVFPYEMHYFFYQNAKIVYEPAGLSYPGAFLNVVMTIPGGIFLFIFFKKHMNIIYIIFIGFFVGCFNEGFQFIFDTMVNLQRTVDITDVITNMAGIILGYITAWLSVIHTNNPKNYLN